ncbi:hypothetical protein [Syntrophomonas palmitatica]|uniref:hypothetical protein n=1 Tax=Syntrophomonas palmitatica TaxID=402877 RepID=UPI0006D2C30A|nr:hypothetical protein [Syntrophomonas palmitatica]
MGYNFSWPAGISLKYNHPGLFYQRQFFSQLIGKMVSRFSGLLTAAVFFITLSLGGTLMDWGRTLFDFNFLNNQFLTGIYFPAGINSLQQVCQTLVFENIVMLITALLVFALAVLVYNRKLEL